MTDKMDISSLRQALTQLDQMYDYTCSPKVKADPVLSSYLRTAVIQAFEYVYEASYKSMRRFLDIYGPVREDESEYLYPELLEISKEYELIDDKQAWLLFRKKRNITSHAYEEAKADDVFTIIPSFLNHAKFLLNALEKKIEATS